MRAALVRATPALALGNAALVMTGVLALREAVVVVVVVGLLLAVPVAGNALAAVRSSCRRRGAGATPWRAFVDTVHVVLPRPLAAVLLHVATMARSLWLALRRRDDGVGESDRAFGYANGTGLTTGALVVVAAVELAVVHLLVPWAALRALLLVAGLWTLLVVLASWAGQRRHPHVVAADRLLLRAGPQVAVEVRWHQVSAVHRQALHEPWSVQVVGRRLHLPVHGSTTLLVELRQPVTAHLTRGRSAEVESIAFTADDPRALRAALLEHAAYLESRPRPTG